MLCPKCKCENPLEAVACVRCGASLGPAPGAPPPAPAQDDVITRLVPYRNKAALAAYYLGLFSIIPCVGLPLGIAAVVLGIMGLKRAKQNPEAKGKIHAWVGIILGGIFGLIYLVLTVCFLIALGAGAFSESSRWVYYGQP